MPSLNVIQSTVLKSQFTRQFLTYLISDVSVIPSILQRKKCRRTVIKGAKVVVAATACDSPLSELALPLAC